MTPTNSDLIKFLANVAAEQYLGELGMLKNQLSTRNVKEDYDDKTP